MTRVAAGLAGPGGSATPGRVLGSGEDVRTVPSWRPLRSASDRGRRCAGGCTRAHRASHDGAWARSHHEELAERALTMWGHQVLSVARFTQVARLATRVEAAVGVASSGLRPSRAVPNGVTPSTVPVTRPLAVDAGSSSSKQLHVPLRRRGGWRSIATAVIPNTTSEQSVTVDDPAITPRRAMCGSSCRATRGRLPFGNTGESGTHNIGQDECQ
jgi:hypothetical protein